MVAICSPPYFVSGWCLSEWDTFRRRAPKLLIPVLYYGNDTYLKRHIDPIQGEDFREFRHMAPGRVHQFNSRIDRLAEVVASKVAAAPPFSAVADTKPVVRRAVTVNVPLYTL